MDITSFSRNDTATINIKDPLGNLTDIVVEIYGRDSKEYRNAVMEINRKGKADNEEELARRGALTMLAAVKSWQNVEADGKPVDPKSEEAVKILADPAYDWFAEQIGGAIYNRTLFFSERKGS